MPSPAKSMWKSHCPVKHFPLLSPSKYGLRTFENIQVIPVSQLIKTTAALEETVQHWAHPHGRREQHCRTSNITSKTPLVRPLSALVSRKVPSENEMPHLHMQTHPCLVPSLFPGIANQESFGTLISVLKLLILCQPAFSRWKLAHLRSSSSGDSFIRSSRFSPSRSKAASAKRKMIVREESNLHARIWAAVRLQGGTITTDYVKIFWILAEFFWVDCYTDRSINDLEKHV